MTIRALPILFVALALVGCGDDPAPVGPAGGGRGSTEAAEIPTAATETPRLDALRHGRGWRITLNRPRSLPADFEPALALLEDAAGNELARSERVEGPIGFAVEASGRIRGVLVAANGRRLEVELDLP